MPTSKETSLQWKNKKRGEKKTFTNSFTVSASTSSKVIKIRRRAQNLLLNYTSTASYRDEESPLATKQPNSINVFTQFNSPSALEALSIVDARKFIKTFFFYSLPGVFFLFCSLHKLFWRELHPTAREQKA